MVVQSRRGWQAIRWAVVGMLGGFGPAALAEPPTRAVYVKQLDGKPGVYQVTGKTAEQPNHLPPIPTPEPGPRLTPAPSGPVPIPGAPTQAVPPAGPTARPTMQPMAMGGYANTDCNTCGPGGKHGGKHGSTSIWGCLWAPATVPPPLGANLRHAFDSQRANALTEYFVLYREDWLNATTTLNTTGARHLDGIIRRFGMIGSPVRVEPTGNAALDENRRAAVADLLVQAGVPANEAMNRVVIGGTRAEGLRYTDIEGVYSRSLGIYTGGVGGTGYGGFGGGFGSGVGYGGGGIIR